MAWVAVRSKALVLLLLIHCSLLLPLLVGAVCLVLVLLCSNKCLFYFCNHLAGKDRAGWFTLMIMTSLGLVAVSAVSVL